MPIPVFLVLNSAVFFPNGKILKSSPQVSVLITDITAKDELLFYVLLNGQYLRRSEETQAKLLFLSYAYVKLNYQDSKGPFKRIECRRGINLSSGGPTDFNMFVASIS